MHKINCPRLSSRFAKRFSDLFAVTLHYQPVNQLNPPFMMNTVD